MVQWALDYAKGFIEDKIKRPSAEDLLVAEDIKLLPKVKPSLSIHTAQMGGPANLREVKALSNH